MEDHSAPSGMSSRFLIIFDFDETIVDANSDDAMVQVAPGKQLPNWLKDTFRPGHFNENTDRVLAYMAKQGVSVEAIRSAIEQIPPSPGILHLFQFLQAHPQDFETVLVSDANMYFIEAWLHRAGARQLFLKIFTNPASINTKGQLQLLPYHSHNCPSCPDNMCKQVILRDYLTQRTKERGRPFQRVCYVGDGANDFCPSLALGPSDVAFPREGYPMHKMITATQQGKSPGFKAAMVPWVSGEVVVAHLKRLVEESKANEPRY